ncbi:MAG: CPBP family intramembrane metalloprotease [Bacteriovoracaceae bacterium]|nr:CPBP family intramembrane metalloprotease [Bacteriovoracaceae bacterium]
MLELIKKNYIPPNYQKNFNWSIASTLILITVVMLLLEYFGWQGPFFKHYTLVPFLQEREVNELFMYAQVYTTFSFSVLFVLLPLCLHFFVPMKTDGWYGLKVTGFFSSMKWYLPLLGIMLPLLWIACLYPNFNKFYPLYRPETVGMWLLFESIYMLQFFCVEFFFRGFCLFRLEKFIPGVAVFIMVIPYALIHIHKPFPEAIGSIFAGIVLGMLALKGRSIWPGVLTHCTVAFCTDFFSLISSGRFPA